MKRSVKIFITGVLFAAVMGFSPGFFMGPGIVHACGNTCGWGSGSAGGGDYVPQGRDLTGPIAQGSFLTKEQAYDIVYKHIKGSSPNLKVGRLNDAGGFYEIEILNDGNNVVQHLGVDKQSGRLIDIN